MLTLPIWVVFPVAFCFLVHIAYLLYWKLPPISKNLNHKSLPNASVIICTHNNLLLLQRGLPSFLSQKHPQFEVIVIDDNSTDGTWDWLQTIHNDNLKIHRLEHSSPGKKDALSAGIQLAQYEWLMLTDADCYVSSPQWIKSIITKCETHTMGYVAYAPYEKMPGLLNRLIRYDTALIAIQYLSMAHRGNAYMGVGRNMGWKKNFVEPLLAGLSKQVTSSGDDDLLLQRAAKKQNIQPILSPDTYVYSAPHTRWKSWLKQKTRHLTTGWYYPLGTRLLLLGWFLTGIFQYVFAVIIFATTPKWVWLGLVIIMARWLLNVLFRQHAFNILLEKDLIPYIPMLDFIHIFVTPFITIKSLFQNNKTWM